MIAVEFMDISQGSDPRGPANGLTTRWASSDAVTALMATVEEGSAAHSCAARHAASSPTSHMSLAATRFRPKRRQMTCQPADRQKFRGIDRHEVDADAELFLDRNEKLNDAQAVKIGVCKKARRIIQRYLIDPLGDKAEDRIPDFKLRALFHDFTPCPAAISGAVSSSSWRRTAFRSILPLEFTGQDTSSTT